GIDPRRSPLDYDTMAGYFSAKELARRNDLIQQALRQGIPYATDFKIIRGDGSLGYIFSKGQPVWNDQQEVIALQGVLMDVTDRKLAEEALQQNEARFQKLAATLPGILFTVVQSPNGTIRFSYCSPLIQSILGITVEQVLADSRSLLDRIHPQDFPRYRRTIQDCIAQLSPFNLDLRMQLPTGQWQWLRVSAQPEYLDQGDIAWYGVSLDITAQKQAEAERDELQERLSLVLQGSNDGWWDWNMVTQEIYISPRWWQMVGYEPGELDPESWYDLIHPEDLPNVQTTLNAFLANTTQQFCEIEYRLRHKQGHDVPVFSRGLTIRDDQGNPLRNVGTNTDLSVLKQKEQQLQDALAALQELNQQLEARVEERTQALADSQHFVEGLLNTSPSLIYLENVQEGNLAFINHGCCTLLGYTPEELIRLGDNVLQHLIHPEDLARVSALSDYQRQGHFTDDEVFEIEYRVCHRTGEWRWFVSQEIVFHRDAQGKVLQVLGNAQDISDRKDIELKNRQLKERLQFVLSANPAVIFTCSPGEDYGATFVSDNIHQVIGYCSEDFLQTSNFWIDHVHPEDLASLLADLPSLFEQGYHRHEYRFLHQEGHYCWVQNELRLVKDAQGNPLEIVGCFVDISERKAHEQALQESYQQLSIANEQLAEVARLKDEFLANMSHELRTPLNAILGLTEALQEKILGELSVKQIKAVNTISDSGQHLLSLINDILDLSKIEAGKMELEKLPVSLGDLCDSCLNFVQQLAQKKAIQVKSSIAQGISDFLADERRLRQILLNLLNNAVKFTPQGGEVELIVTLNEAMLQFQVRDTGIGISPTNQTKLFQSFVQIYFKRS
ncbi:MAG: PAS domain-containing protein, partial [Microcystaceae cyanobacterium]